MRKGWVKGICAVVCVLLLNVGVWGCVLFGLWEVNWGQDDQFYESAFYWESVNEHANMAAEAFALKIKADGGALSNYERSRLNELEEKLNAENTNFRFSVCRESDGQFLYGNVGAREQWETEVFQIYTRRATYWDYGNIPVMSDVQDAWISAKITYGVTWPLAGEDDFTHAEEMHREVDGMMPFVLGLGIVCAVMALILLILLMRTAGRRPGREDVVLNWHDKIPYDLYLAMQAGLIVLAIASLVESTWYIEWDMHWIYVLWLVGSGLACSIFAVAVLLTTATRIKARTIFRNTVIWWLCKLLWRGVKKLWISAGKAVHALPLIWRSAVIFLIYAAGNALFFFVTPLWVIWQALALFYVCTWVFQWRKIRGVTGEIVAGKTDVTIESGKFYPDLKEHAGQLGDLGGAIDNAVNERMKSERFKSELITNVSHDLKTPLTSIINYVDLLKKEEIDNPTAKEYIEVLDRKSQRLKKLTEDLVEASKASTGALTVSKDDLDLAQLIRQAVGEYGEKLTQADLTPVIGLPGEELRVCADGRHLWRVLDNLLSNCVKYALEGTRVYLDAAAWNGNAVITVKNVSREALNVPAEQLTERFVRGDASRTAEGSGLGLSIARSLTELQGGRFALSVDGDLFKATVTLPLNKG